MCVCVRVCVLCASQGVINVINGAIKKGVKKFVLVTSLGCGNTKDTVGEKVRVVPELVADLCHSMALLFVLRGMSRSGVGIGREWPMHAACLLARTAGASSVRLWYGKTRMHICVCVCLCVSPPGVRDPQASVG